MHNRVEDLLTPSFLKAALFTQVFKTSVAISVVNACPDNLEVGDFTERLQKSYNSYEEYVNLSLHHILQTKSPFVIGLYDAELNVDLFNEENTNLSFDSILSKLSTGVTSIRDGFRILSEITDSLQESYIMPRISFLLKTLSWLNKHNSELEEIGLLKIVASLHADASDAFKSAGELVAKLDVNEISTVETSKYFSYIVRSACHIHEGNTHGCWIYPVKSFLNCYLKLIHENAKTVKPLRVANSLTKCLLSYICQFLHVSDIETRAQSHELNESFARAYSFTMPLLNSYIQKTSIDDNLVEAISSTIDIIQRKKISKKEETWLSNAALLLLQSLKNKLQYLNDL